MAKKMKSKEYYAGMDSRRKQEARDGSMLHEDHRAIANMPEEVIMKEYPKPLYFYDGDHIDDTIKGIDRQKNDDVSQARRHMAKSKY